MAYKYGCDTTTKNTKHLNGVGRRHMGDRIGRRTRQQIDLAHRQPLAQLQNPRCGKDILPGRALAQK